MRESWEERLPLKGEPSLSRSAPSTFISGHFWKCLTFNFNILWPAKISMNAKTLNAANCKSSRWFPSITFPLRQEFHLFTIKDDQSRVTLFHLKNVIFLFLSVQRLVSHDAKIPAGAKSAARFSSTGDQSYSVEIFFKTTWAVRPLKKARVPSFWATFNCQRQYFCTARSLAVLTESLLSNPAEK